ncbi:MAG: glycoside-pentoside-hexuronide (GPH):cation symporter [Bacilli bacterium]
MKINETYEGNKIPRSTKRLYSSGTIARDAAYTLVSLFFLTYIQFCAPLGYATEIIEGTRSNDLYIYQMLVISAIVIVCRVWDGFNDPIMGWIIEKAHFKTGKYKPWILIGGLTNAVVLFLMFYLQPVGWYYVLAFAAFYLLWDFTFTMNDIGYRSMLPSLSNDEKERNQITTLVSVFSSVGAFAAGGIIPMVVSGNAKNMYAIVGGVIALLFAISQAILFFFCKEHKRDAAQTESENKAKFTDMFKLLKTNDQLRVITIVILIYYLGSAILNALGLNYFYFLYGYAEGGTIQFIFTVVYAAGTILAQIAFPFLSKKFNRSQLFFISFIVLAIGYVIFFIYQLPVSPTLTLGPKLGGTADIIILSFIGVFIFAGQGLFYLIILVMMANTIEYNEYKTGERKEAIIFAFRPLTAKLSSAMQAGVVAATLAITGLYAISSGISDIELNRGLGLAEFAGLTEAEKTILAQELAQKEIDVINFTQIIALKATMCLLPLVLFIISFVLIKMFYKIDEPTYQSMCKEIEMRKGSVNL